MRCFMENNIFYGKDESKIISHKKTDYYSLCSLLRKQKLFEVMMVDFEKPDLPPDEIRKLYYRYIEEYMYTALGTSALKKDKVDLFYFSALTVVYLCYNVYPGWGNNDLDDGHYIEIDDLVEYLYHFTEDSEKDIRVSMNTLKPLCYLMYSVTQHNYSCELSKEFHILERCEETWVKDLIKLICFNESLHDGQSMDEMCIRDRDRRLYPDFRHNINRSFYLRSCTSYSYYTDKAIYINYLYCRSFDTAYYTEKNYSTYIISDICPIFTFTFTIK